MSQIPPKGPLLKPDSPGERRLQESNLAIQKPSTGGFLVSKERSGWDWLIFIITFQWVVAFFAPEEGELKDYLVDALAKKFPQNKQKIKTILEQESYEDIQNFSTLLDNVPNIREYVEIYPENIQRFLSHPAKTRYAFQLFNAAQRLLGNSDENYVVLNWMVGLMSPLWLESFEMFIKEKNLGEIAELKAYLDRDETPPPAVKAFLQEIVNEKTSTIKKI